MDSGEVFVPQKSVAVEKLQVHLGVHSKGVVHAFSRRNLGVG